jgi:hypothetical protein
LCSTSAGSTRRTTQTCSLAQKFSQRPRRTFWDLARREMALGIEHDGVMMVRESASEEDRDLTALCGVSEAVEESVVGRGIGAQQELTLGAAPRDHIEPPGDDFAGQAHDTRSGRRGRGWGIMRGETGRN